MTKAHCSHYSMMKLPSSGGRDARLFFRDISARKTYHRRAMKITFPLFIVVSTLLLTPSLEAQTGSQYRSGHQHVQPSNQQAVIARELQCLTQTAASLEQLFADHLRRNRPRPTRAEMDFSTALHELNEDIQHFSNDLRGGQSLDHIYRTFHMVDYSAQDTWALAAQAGYARSLNGWLADIDDHVRHLGEQGMRNPRFQQIQMDNRYHNQYRSQQGDFQFAPVPLYDERGNRINPQQPISGPTRPGERPRDGEIRINLGEALGRIFGGRR